MGRKKKRAPKRKGAGASKRARAARRPKEAPGARAKAKHEPPPAPEAESAPTPAPKPAAAKAAAAKARRKRKPSKKAEAPPAPEAPGGPAEDAAVAPVAPVAPVAAEVEPARRAKAKPKRKASKKASSRSSGRSSSRPSSRSSGRSTRRKAPPEKPPMVLPLLDGMGLPEPGEAVESETAARRATEPGPQESPGGETHMAQAAARKEAPAAGKKARPELKVVAKPGKPGRPAKAGKRAKKARGKSAAAKSPVPAKAAATAKPGLKIAERASPAAEAGIAVEPAKPVAAPDAKPAAKKRNGTPRPGGNGAQAPPATAESMASQQREISVAEFFQKNRHLLGFDNPRKALLTAIKEAVDNSLDACEEARILPDVRVEVKHTRHEERFVIAIQDNGPGIMKEQIARIFGKLLYGSKFHRLKMSRGQQGIGISAAGMYGQLTTGKPVRIWSRTGPGVPAQYYELMINTTKNEPVIVGEEEVGDWKLERGTRVEIELVARYQKGRQSIDEYLEETAVACPHVRLTYRSPDGHTKTYRRATEVLPDEPREIRPHPHGVELGLLMKMLKDSKERWLTSFLHNSFSRVSTAKAKAIAKLAKVAPKFKPSRLKHEEVDRLYSAINATQIMAPPTNCLSPIGVDQIQIGLKKRIKADFVTAVSRRPSVYRGNPFLVEAGLAYGGEQEAEGLVRLLRFANRVPLLYQKSACAIYDAVVDAGWRNYQVTQGRGALPAGPMTIMVHFASAWVPFTSESKEAIASYPEITREMRLALRECGRNLAQFLRRRRRAQDAERKRSYIEKYIPHIGIGLREILGFPAREEARVVKKLRAMLEQGRAKADGEPEAAGS